MPAQGLDWLAKPELMSTQEMLRLCALLVKMGIDKIRITGGEPFVRKDLLPFLWDLSRLSGLSEITLTTNGLLTAPYAADLKKMGIRSVNLSLDTLDRQRFQMITRRDALNDVLNSLDAFMSQDIQVKINTVVMEGKNTQDIIPLVELSEHLPVSVRFIEEMPFNGGTHDVSLNWNFSRILEHIKAYFPALQKKRDPQHSTALNYKIQGHKGDIGIIAAYTRSFCGSCNRLRVTPSGLLSTCLYEAGSLNLKELMRAGATDALLEAQLHAAILKKPLDGWEAAAGSLNYQSEHQSMATIGG